MNSSYNCLFFIFLEHLLSLVCTNQPVSLKQNNYYTSLNIQISCPVNISAIMVQVLIDSMELSVEYTFQSGLYKKYESLKKETYSKTRLFVVDK